MSQRINITLPEEILADLGNEDLSSKAKEALVMELLREHKISQGKAAELLEIPREDLFPLMTRYRVPVVDMTSEELEEELRKPNPPP